MHQRMRTFDSVRGRAAKREIASETERAPARCQSLVHDGGGWPASDSPYNRPNPITAPEILTACPFPSSSSATSVWPTACA